MRLLIATWHQGIIGGAETYLRDLLPALRRRGHELALLVEYLATPSQARLDADHAGPLWQITSRTREEVFAQLNDWRPDLCFLHGLEEPGLQEALAQRFPTVLFAHNYHGTCISGNKRFTFPVERPCSKTFGPACLGHYLLRGCGGRNPLEMVRLYRRQQRRRGLLDAYRAIVVASRAMHAEYLRHGIPAERVHCVPLFPTGQASTACAPPHARSGRLLLLGRLTDVKGGHLAIAAARLAGQVTDMELELVVAGDGPERPRLEALARRLGVRARFLGWQEGRDRGATFAQADLILVPSVWPEPFGLTGLEAAWHGVPAVAFAVGGIPDWLTPGHNGELAPGDPPTAPGLADALVRALGNEEHYQRLREGAWRSAQAFSLEGHVERLEAILLPLALDTSPTRQRGRLTIPR